MSKRRKTWVVMAYLNNRHIIFTQASAFTKEEAIEEAMIVFAEEGAKLSDGLEIVYVGKGRIGDNEYNRSENLVEVGLRNAMV